MGQSKHQPASSLPLEELIASAFSALEGLRYSRQSLRRYRTIWQQVLKFSRPRELFVP